MTKKGSILIWTVFLGLFISVFFVAFQSRLEQYFAQTKHTENILSEGVALREALESLKQKPQAYIHLSESTTLEAIDFDGSSYILSLPLWYATELRLTNTGGTSNLPIQVLAGGPIKYLSATSASITNSGVVFDTGNIIITGTSRIIYLENLGGFVKIRIQKGATDLLPPQTHYQKVQKQGDISRVSGNYSIRHFSLLDAGIDYTTLGMYLNAKEYDK